MNKVMKRPVRTFGFWDPFLNDFSVRPVQRSVTKPTFRKSVPAVNIKEMESSFSLELAGPGLSKEDFKISVVDDILIISASKEQNEEQKTDSLIRREFSYFNFERKFNLDGKVNKDEIVANYENGVLMINLPKTEAVKNTLKTIEIQ